MTTDGVVTVPGTDPAYLNYIQAVEDMEFIEAALEAAKQRKSNAVKAMAEKYNSSRLEVGGQSMDVRTRGEITFLCTARTSKK